MRGTLIRRLPRRHALPSPPPATYMPPLAGGRASSAASPRAPSNFVPRLSFAFPSTIPSWYAGHMYRAMRSLPSLLARQPPPLVVEVRDARLTLSSINPAFEQLLRQRASADGDEEVGDWKDRRLVVYAKSDLIDESLQEPIRRAFKKHGDGQEVLFVDTRNDADVKAVTSWIHARAAALSAAPTAAPSMRSIPRSARSRNLSGAFKHTPTPEVGARLVIVGSPNVGKSSLLNALRRVGTGKGKAASTAPEPGHTRKLTGTVRITKAGPTSVRSEKTIAPDPEAALFKLGSVDEDEDGNEISSSAQKRKDKEVPVYVYDTPGIMVPFLGRGAAGAEKGIKLAVAHGMKSSLFDTQTLVDYLLFRLNLQHAYAVHQQNLALLGSSEPLLPVYLTRLPMPPHDADGKALQPTNDIVELLELVAIRAPGTLARGGIRDLDGAATFMLQRWREGKLGREAGELDLGLWELPSEMPIPSSAASFVASVEEDGETVRALAPEPTESPEQRIARLKADLKERSDVELRVDAMVKRHFEALRAAEIAGVGTSARPARGAGRDYLREINKEAEADLSPIEEATENIAEHGMLSKTQARKQDRKKTAAIRREKLLAKGIIIDRFLQSSGEKSTPASVFRPPKNEKFSRPHKPSGSRLAAKRRNEAMYMRAQAGKFPAPDKKILAKRSPPPQRPNKVPPLEIYKDPALRKSAAASTGRSKAGAEHPLPKRPRDKPQTAPGTWASSLKTVRMKMQAQSAARKERRMRRSAAKAKSGAGEGAKRS